ncbi:hypothetical protein BBP40_004742 [Aspergillus hancockii]|nr:hypothetical protein BBP40_004742 [Aspergillus hancockii]
MPIPNHTLDASVLRLSENDAPIATMQLYRRLFQGRKHLFAPSDTSPAQYFITNPVPHKHHSSWKPVFYRGDNPKYRPTSTVIGRARRTAMWGSFRLWLGDGVQEVLENEKRAKAKKKAARNAKWRKMFGMQPKLPKEPLEEEQEVVGKIVLVELIRTSDHTLIATFEKGRWASYKKSVRSDGPPNKKKELIGKLQIRDSSCTLSHAPTTPPLTGAGHSVFSTITARIDDTISKTQKMGEDQDLNLHGAHSSNLTEDAIALTCWIVVEAEHRLRYKVLDVLEEIGESIRGHAFSASHHSFLLGKIPLVIKTTVAHVLGLSPASQKWDLRTSLTVTIIRDVLCNSPPSTVTEQQQSTLQDPGVKGGMWVSRVTVPAPPESALQDALFQAIQALGTGSEEYSKPSLQPVTAEWTGHRANVSTNTPEPRLSEVARYQCLMDETANDATLLYFHGGSYYLMDPCSHREAVAGYARRIGGRVLSVRYRLAPQNPFPSALLDALVVYLWLLYPPESAFHQPVPASHIVFAGDSAGGNLATVLLQTILQLHRGTSGGDLPLVMFYGTLGPVPLPAGIALTSPSLDLTRSMQSSETYAQYDYLPPPSFSSANSPPCAIWPADPPRVDLFCEGSALCHPLVSPVAAPSWAGSPPIFICCGEELLKDECKFFAQKAARQGAKVIWEQYEAMPHCFAHVLQGSRASLRSLSSYADFVLKVVQGSGDISTKGEFFTARTLDSDPMNVSSLTKRTDEEVLKGLELARNRIVSNARNMM